MIFCALVLSEVYFDFQYASFLQAVSQALSLLSFTSSSQPLAPQSASFAPCEVLQTSAATQSGVQNQFLAHDTSSRSFASSSSSPALLSPIDSFFSLPTIPLVPSWAYFTVLYCLYHFVSKLLAVNSSLSMPYDCLRISSLNDNSKIVHLCSSCSYYETKNDFYSYVYSQQSSFSDDFSTT